MNVAFTSKVEEHYRVVDGIRTRYLTAGEGDVVLLIHGLGGFAEYWQPLIDALSPDHRVVALDLPGFGRSEKLRDRLYTYQTFAPFVLSFLDALGVSTAALVGHSLGGGIALQAAIIAPARVTKLVLVSSGGLSPDFSIYLRLLTLPVVGKLMARPSREGARRSCRACVYDPSIVRDEWVANLYEMSSSPGASAVLVKTMRDGANLAGGFKRVIRPIVDNLHTITASTLVIWGEEDAIIPYRHATVAIDTIADCRLLALKRCGHMPFVEYPGKVCREVAAFIGTDATGRS